MKPRCLIFLMLAFMGIQDIAIAADPMSNVPRIWHPSGPTKIGEIKLRESGELSTTKMSLLREIDNEEMRLAYNALGLSSESAAGYKSQLYRTDEIKQQLELIGLSYMASVDFASIDLYSPNVDAFLVTNYALLDEAINYRGADSSQQAQIIVWIKSLRRRRASGVSICVQSVSAPSIQIILQAKLPIFTPAAVARAQNEIAHSTMLHGLKPESATCAALYAQSALLVKVDTGVSLYTAYDNLCVGSNKEIYVEAPTSRTWFGLWREKHHH